VRAVNALAGLHSFARAIPRAPGFSQPSMETFFSGTRIFDVSVLPSFFFSQRKTRIGSRPAWASWHKRYPFSAPAQVLYAVPSHPPPPFFPLSVRIHFPRASFEMMVWSSTNLRNFLRRYFCCCRGCCPFPFAPLSSCRACHLYESYPSLFAPGRCALLGCSFSFFPRVPCVFCERFNPISRERPSPVNRLQWLRSILPSLRKFVPYAACRFFHTHLVSLPKQFSRLP